MPLLPRLFSLWRNLFHKSRKEQELTEELDAYLELLIEQKIEQGLEVRVNYSLKANGIELRLIRS
jgi:hypothetical protein